MSGGRRRPIRETARSWISLLLTLLVVGAVSWRIHRHIPMAAGIRPILHAAAAIATVPWVLGVPGLAGGSGHIHDGGP